MTSEPQVHSQFSVTSGALCYGALHNIWHGSSSPLQQLPVTETLSTGTVRHHSLDYNVQAENGEWSAYQLIDLSNQIPCAWFACHSDVDPVAEMDKILRVSGSPYEEDSGSNMNTDETFAQGVLVVNRYDWVGYDRRGRENKNLTAHEYDPDAVYTGEKWEAVGLVDLERAQAQVLEWKDIPSPERSQSVGAVWMHIPGGEYCFGRFGLDEDRTAARSFLFFTMYTDFTQTAFAGEFSPFRTQESATEKFHRQLSEGVNFEGFDGLRRMMPSMDQGANVQLLKLVCPSASERLGPFSPSEHLFEDLDLESIRVSAGAHDFADQLKEPVFELLNEVMMCYLSRAVATVAAESSTLASAFGALCPNHTSPNTVDADIHPRFMGSLTPDTIPQFDNRAVERRIKSFLLSNGGDGNLVNDESFIAGICRALVYLVARILKNACGFNWELPKIIPSDIRYSIYMDRELFPLLKYSNIYWGPIAQEIYGHE